MRENFKKEVTKELNLEIKCTCFDVLDKWNAMGNSTEMLYDKTVFLFIKNYLVSKLKKEPLKMIIEFHQKIFEYPDDFYRHLIFENFFELVKNTLEMEEAESI